MHAESAGFFDNVLRRLHRITRELTICAGMVARAASVSLFARASCVHSDSLGFAIAFAGCLIRRFMTCCKYEAIRRRTGHWVIWERRGQYTPILLRIFTPLHGVHALHGSIGRSPRLLQRGFWLRDTSEVHAFRPEFSPAGLRALRGFSSDPSLGLCSDFT